MNTETYEVQITASGKRFAAVLAKIKTLSGATYDASTKTWTIDLDPADSYRFGVLTDPNGYGRDITVERVA